MAKLSEQPTVTVMCALHAAGRAPSCLAALREALAGLQVSCSELQGVFVRVYCIAPAALAAQLAPLLPQFAPFGGAQHCVPRDGETWYAAANRLVGEMLADALANDTPPLLLLLHEDVTLAPDSLVAMRARLVQNTDGNIAGSVCGVTPLLLTPPFASGNQYILHLGTVADVRQSLRAEHSTDGNRNAPQQLYHLYEGIPADYALTRASLSADRTYQTAPEVTLLVRLQDFAAVGGFARGLDELTGLDLGLRLARHTGQGFACAPKATAVWHDLDASWRICGLWNSLAQRGRFAPGTLQDDYADILADDGVAPGINEWLALCPQIPRFPQAPQSSQNTPPAQSDEPASATPADSFEAAWLASRQHNPVAMLQYLQATPHEELPQRLELCRSLPELHPHAFAWYTAQAASLLDWARETGHTELAAQVSQWQKRARRFHHGLLKPVMQALLRCGFYNVALDSQPAQYDAWLELEEPQQRADMGKLDVGRTWPEIAVIVPVYNPEPRFLREALDSVLAQRYDRWQLCVADDASTNADIAPILREYAAREPRMCLTFREQNGHISRASNSALELADAPFAAFFDHDDLLHPDALARVAQHLADNPAVRFVYTDEDKVDTDGVRRTPIFKPDFDMDLHYTWHLSTYATDILRAVGGLREGLEGSQDFDLSLRVTEQLAPQEIAHIPAVLYHWRIHANSTTAQLGAKPYVLEATQRALRDSLQRRGLHGAVHPTGKNNFYRPLLTLSEMGKPEGRERPRVQLVLLGGQRPISGSLQAQIDALARSVPVEVCWQEYGQWHCKPPRSSDALHITVFLDTSLVPGPNCHLDQLVAHALRPEIAIACGELWIAGLLFNGGWYPDVTGVPFAPMSGASPEEIRHGAFGQFLCNRRVLAPAWQCVTVKTADFERLGGLDATFCQWAWVDYALRAEAAGLGHCLLTPWAQWQVTCPETPERFDHGVSAEVATRCLRQRWGGVITRHGTRNPLLQASPDNGWALRFTS